MFHAIPAHHPLRSLAALAAASLAVLCSGAASAQTRPSASPQSAIVGKCRADLGARLHISVDQVKLVEAVPAVWPDASLGLPREGELAAQVLTPGWRIILSARSRKYLYTAGTRAFRYGGPTAAWSCSALYLVPIPNEPNLNGDLMQVSLAGTNPTRLMGGVSDFFPQPNGGILATRRTSRSGFTLLYRPPGAGAATRELNNAFAFGGAALSPAGDEWVAFRRTGFAGRWVLAHGKLDGGKVEAVEVPDAARSGALVWDDGRLLAHINVGERAEHYEVVVGNDGWSLRKMGAYDTSLGSSILLNKSETLEVKVVGDGQQAATRVSTVWFTGDERPIATIEGFVFNEMTPGPGTGLLFLSGTRNGVPAAYTVVVSSGEVIPLPLKGGRTAKLCCLPPQSQPGGARATTVE